jgi:hypothetical protein
LSAGGGGRGYFELMCLRINKLRIRIQDAQQHTDPDLALEHCPEVMHFLKTRYGTGTGTWRNVTAGVPSTCSNCRAARISRRRAGTGSPPHVAVALAKILPSPRSSRGHASSTVSSTPTGSPSWVNSRSSWVTSQLIQDSRPAIPCCQQIFSNIFDRAKNSAFSMQNC